MSYDQKLRQWRAEPATMVYEVYGADPDPFQADALALLTGPSPIRIALRACVGPGKSTYLVWAAGWILLCHADMGEHPAGIAVSCTLDNLKSNLWRELAKWHNRSKLMQEHFDLAGLRYFNRRHRETWFLDGRGFAKAADPEEQGRTLSGHHSRYPFVLLDESGDMAPSLLRAAEQALSTCERGWLLTAGNTTSQAGALYQATVNEVEKWRVISITGDPDDPKRSSRVDIEWAQDQIKKYGRDNPWVQAMILGQFPDVGMNTLLSVTEVEEAMRRRHDFESYGFAQKRIGVDVARFGDDATVLFPRQGKVAFRPAVMRSARTHEIAARVAQAKKKFGSELEFIDATGGWGGGVIDSLMQYGHSPQAVNFSESATDPGFRNKRTEMWFRMADWIRTGGSLPRVPELVRELSTPMYSFVQGRFALEEKEQIKKRVGWSPDHADALALTFALDEMPSLQTVNLPGYDRVMSQQTGQAKIDYDVLGGE